MLQQLCKSDVKHCNGRRQLIKGLTNIETHRKPIICSWTTSPAGVCHMLTAVALLSTMLYTEGTVMQPSQNTYFGPFCLTVVLHKLCAAGCICVTVQSSEGQRFGRSHVAPASPQWPAGQTSAGKHITSLRMMHLDVQKCGGLHCVVQPHQLWEPHQRQASFVGKLMYDNLSVNKRECARAQPWT